VVAVTAPRRRATVAMLVGLLVLGAWRADHSWRELAPDELGPYRGWVGVVDDPQPYDASTRVIVDVAGERFELWARGRALRQRVRRWRAGEWVLVEAERVALRDERARRVAWQHVVGELRLRWASDVRPGGAVDRASNRLRAAIERAAERLPEADGALYRGLVIGDDRDQSPAMLERFRGSGLSHLSAVSGQNVAFVLAAFAPLLRRLPSIARLLVTVALIGWFVALTRFEPSIVRAGAMAALSVTAFTTGRERSPVRLLALAVIALVLVDPLLVHSVGFQLSVGATAGVTTAGPWVAARLAWLGPLATPVGITLGAQLGVVIPSVAVFGRLPLMSVPANVLAVPVAGAVMLYGLPAGLAAGWMQPLAPVLMAPIRVGTRWIDAVAALAVRLEPPGAWPWVGWALLCVVVLVASASAFVRRPRAGKNRDPHDPPPVDR
jgi:competence protein ComEC